MTGRTWSFPVDGDPVPWARPRKAKWGGYYEKPEVTVWRRVVATAAMQVKPPRPTTSPVWLTTIFYLKRPRSVRKTIYYHTKKPDIDNYYKAIADALSGVIYEDDRLIVGITAWKEYVTEHHGPGVLIRIRELIP